MKLEIWQNDLMENNRTVGMFDHTLSIFCSIDVKMGEFNQPNDIESLTMSLFARAI
jgi:hypothetical protein